MDQISDELINKRKNMVLVSMNPILKKFRDLTEQIRTDIKTDAKDMTRLGYYNGPLLAIALVMYNSNITLQVVKSQPSVLDSYAAYLDNKNITDGVRNDILRYLFIVTDYYANLQEKSIQFDVHNEREDVLYDEFD